MTKALLLFLCLLLVQDSAENKREFERRRDELKGSADAGAYVVLGGWCAEKGLRENARWSFVKAYELDRSHAGIRPGMLRIGYDLDGDLWRPVRDVYAKRRTQTPVQDFDKRYELAAYALEVGLEKEWKRDCEDIVRLDPEHRQARAALGYTLFYGRWLTPSELEVERKLDETWQKLLSEKRAAADALAELKAGGYKGTLANVQQVLAWAQSPTGTHKDVRLAADAQKYPGEYTYGIPSTYIPWRSHALIVFLHGGGDGVGDGDDYFPQVWPQSGPKGYITVCPTVLERTSLAWNNERHEQYVRAVVREIRSKYNVDADRTYLMGHSMGGFGCFWIGTRTTDLFAAISPWSGGPGGATLSALKHTPTYIIHGNRDQQVNVSGSREAAKQLAQFKYPHVYVEMSIDGHGVPDPEKEKALEWIGRQRFNPAARRK